MLFELSYHSIVSMNSSTRNQILFSPRRDGSIAEDSSQILRSSCAELDRPYPIIEREAYGMRINSSNGNEVQEQESCPDHSSDTPKAFRLGRRDGTFEHDEGPQDEALQDVETQIPPNRYHQFRQCVCNRLYAALAPIICILNIASAIGCVFLANYSIEQLTGIFIGTFITWLSTCGIMALHGAANTGSLKVYARQLAIVALITCSIVGILFRITGVPNISSASLVGITIAVFDHIEDVSISLCCREAGRALRVHQ